MPGAASSRPSTRPIVAVEESDVREAWRDLMPRLFLAGGVAFFAGVHRRRPARALDHAAAAPHHRGVRRDGARPLRPAASPRTAATRSAAWPTAFNDMAQQVNRSHRTLRDFLANVSHELKTPLTSIQGFSQAMVDGSLQTPEDYAEAGRIVNDEAVRMRGLVDDLLYLSQVDARRVRRAASSRSWPNELLRRHPRALHPPRRAVRRRPAGAAARDAADPGRRPPPRAGAGQHRRQRRAPYAERRQRHPALVRRERPRALSRAQHRLRHPAGSPAAASSTASSRPTPPAPAPTATPASASRSRRRSSKRTAATST